MIVILGLKVEDDGFEEQVPLGVRFSDDEAELLGAVNADLFEDVRYISFTPDGEYEHEWYENDGPGFDEEDYDDQDNEEEDDEEE